MFGDDTNLLFKHANINQLFVNVNDELKKIIIWFSLNKLLLHIKKTNFIIFNNKNKIINTQHLNVIIDIIVIDQVLGEMQRIAFRLLLSICVCLCVCLCICHVCGRQENGLW